MDDYTFFVNLNTRRYAGEWIAIADQQVLAHGSDAKKVFADAKKATTTIPYLAFIPREETVLL